MVSFSRNLLCDKAVQRTLQPNIYCRYKDSVLKILFYIPGFEEYSYSI